MGPVQNGQSCRYKVLNRTYINLRALSMCILISMMSYITKPPNEASLAEDGGISRPLQVAAS